MVLLFSATMFLSAGLLFVIQPMVGKMVLPLFGGTAGVWTTCMVFFQAILLAGYAYAHGSMTWLGVRRQMALHFVLMLLVVWFLPIAINASDSRPTLDHPLAWLLFHLLTTAGPPLLVVSSTAPLLQAWFARTGHASAGDPYFLYAASNTGSLLALLGYPLIFERLLPLDAQSTFWAGAFLVMIALVLISAVVTVRNRASQSLDARPQSCDEDRPIDAAVSIAPITTKRRLKWIVLAAVPSSLLLGVTTHITTNIAAVPLLWVLPLALYLTTFILVFARRPILPNARLVRAMPYVVIAIGPLIFLELAKLQWAWVPAHLFMFFVVTMVCHGELVAARPPATNLTEFYLWMSVGGVLGGLFNSVVAPVVFSSVIEYPLMLAVACLLMPPPKSYKRTLRAFRLDVLIPLGVAAFCIAMTFLVDRSVIADTHTAVSVVTIVSALLCFASKGRPVRFGLSIAVFLATVAAQTHPDADRILYVGRNFFGVKHVQIDEDGKFIQLVHGTTLHGQQFVDPARSDEPTAYYACTGPVGDIFGALHSTGSRRNVAVIGLGTGAVATYIQPGERVTFFEIDPDIERIARNPKFFTFLRNCRGSETVVLGDGRLSLKQHHEMFDLIMLDAFSSDSVPTHLLSEEALDLYLTRLNPHGLLVFHVSNRYLDLGPVLGVLARRAGLVALRRQDTVVDEERADGKLPSQYLVMARTAGDLGPIATNPEWTEIPQRAGTAVWTDQYCNILSVLKVPSE